MDSIHISTGEKRIAIERDGKQAGEIVFTPTDALFAEKFYHLLGEFDTKLDEYRKRSDAIDASQKLDGYGLPINADERINLLKEACTYIRGKIDYVFGEGTSQAAFGDALSMDVFEQFFSGITPYIRQARTQLVAKYAVTPKPARKRAKK